MICSCHCSPLMPFERHAWKALFSCEFARRSQMPLMCQRPRAPAPRDGARGLIRGGGREYRCVLQSPIVHRVPSVRFVEAVLEVQIGPAVGATDGAI